jgi:hypothetical protein
MTVAELREILKDLPDDLEVFILNTMDAGTEITHDPAGSVDLQTIDVSHVYQSTNWRKVAVIS